MDKIDRVCKSLSANSSSTDYLVQSNKIYFEIRSIF